MSEHEFSPRDFILAQRRFTLFTALNVVSFQLLSGNIITLFALRLEASNFLIGLLFSFVPLAQVMPLVGRIIVARIGAVKTMSRFWLLRYLLMAPILFAPLFAAADRQDIGIILIVISVVGFNLARGIGITGHNPIVAGITTERDRGSFLSRNQLVVHAGSILIGAAMALLLGAISSLVIYSVLIATGIAAGILASVAVGKIPEPPNGVSGSTPRMVDGVRRAIAAGGLGRFLVVLGLKSFLISMALPFLVVYLKRVHAQGDSTVVVFTVIGSLGAITMALISGLAIDSTGPKPVSQIFGSVLLIALLLVVVIPGGASTPALFILTGLVFFLATMGANGLDNGMSNYFFRLIPSSEVLNVGIVNFLVSGAAATSGSLAGGAILDALERTALSVADSFRVYYGGLVALVFVLLAVTTTLPRLGPAYSARNVLAMFFSPRDLQAMSLLRRFRKGGERKEESDRDAITALGQTRSTLSTGQLLAELSSPRFGLRSAALNAISRTAPTDQAVEALIEQVRTQQFTTAYRAAEILGQWRTTEAIPALREALLSSDYFLCGKSMIALAQLGDLESTQSIEGHLATTNNPRMIIHGASALEIIGNPTSVPVLITVLKKRLSAFVRDEVNLALSGILGLQDMFYPLYLAFIEDGKLGVASLKDYIAEQISLGDQPTVNAEILNGLAAATLGEDFSNTVTTVLDNSQLNVGGQDMVPVLLEAVRDPVLVKLSRFRFLLACVAIRSAFTDGHEMTP